MNHIQTTAQLRESGHFSPCCCFLFTNSPASLWFISGLFYFLWSILDFCHMSIIYLSSVSLVILYFCWQWSNRFSGFMYILLCWESRQACASWWSDPLKRVNWLDPLEHLSIPCSTPPAGHTEWADESEPHSGTKMAGHQVIPVAGSTEPSSMPASHWRVQRHLRGTWRGYPHKILPLAFQIPSQDILGVSGSCSHCIASVRHSAFSSMSPLTGFTALMHSFYSNRPPAA